MSGAAARPRVAGLGAGWIGRARLSALEASGLAELVGVADPDPAAQAAVAAELPGVPVLPDLAALLALRPDGVAIATPSAGHAEQAGAALAGAASVFCEKPLARTAAETRAVLTAAREADRRLEVDLSYRHLRAARAVRALVRDGALGRVYAAELVFHNAYGPDKPWFLTRSQSGGGCLVDLGTHLVDLLLWLTGEADAAVAGARVRRGGTPLDLGGEAVEDLALAQLDTPSGIVVRLACSWFLPAGRDCVFECTLYGTEGAASVRNVDGSFYDFAAERWRGTHREELAAPQDDWGAGAIRAWAGRLATDPGFDPAAVAEAEAVAAILEAIYAAAR